MTHVKVKPANALLTRLEAQKFGGRIAHGETVRIVLGHDGERVRTQLFAPQQRRKGIPLLDNAVWQLELALMEIDIWDVEVGMLPSDTIECSVTAYCTNGAWHFDLTVGDVTCLVEACVVSEKRALVAA